MKKHLEVVGAVVIEDGRVLAAKRGESKYPYVAHKYEFAGGKIEPGEEREAARDQRGAACRHPHSAPVSDARARISRFYHHVIHFFVPILLCLLQYGA